MSALQNALRPALTPALGSARRGVSRYFTQFDPVAQSYISLSSDFELLSDFLVTSRVALRAGAVNHVFGNSRNFFNRLSVFSDGSANVRSASNEIISISAGVFTPFFGKLIELVVERVSNTVNLYLNGSIIGSNSIDQSDLFTINQIARNNGNTFPPDTYELFSINDSGVDVVKHLINRYYTPQSNTVLDESGSGNHGTFVNIAAGRSKYYQQRADGNFVDLQGNVLEVAY